MPLDRSRSLRLASLSGFTSGQPDGGRSHCGTPGSYATCSSPEDVLRCKPARRWVACWPNFTSAALANCKQFARRHPRKGSAFAACPKAYAVWPARRLCRQLALGASWVRCCRGNERLAFRTSRIAVWVPRTVIHVAFRKRSAGASRRARPASQGMGCASRGKLASALASTASCSHKPPYSAFAGRWCS